MSQVTALLDRLAAGEVTVEAVAQNFASRQWPAGPSAAQQREDALTNADPDPMVEGSFAEVEAAYVNGQLDEGQYAVLAEAAASAM